MAKKISVRIKGGKFTIQTTGYAGTTCEQATERLEQRLGTKLTDQPTAEMFEQPEVAREHE